MLIIPRLKVCKEFRLQRKQPQAVLRSISKYIAVCCYLIPLAKYNQLLCGQFLGPDAEGKLVFRDNRMSQIKCDMMSAPVCPCI